MNKLICSLCLIASLTARAQNSAQDILAQVDPATGKVEDGTKSFTISGIVTTRLVQDSQTTAYVLIYPESPTVAVRAGGRADAAVLLPRNQITLSGKLADSPLGAVLQVQAGSVAITDTNKPFKSQSIGAATFKDASALAGDYLQLTNVTFADAKFDNSGTAKVKADDGTTVTLLVSKSAAGRETPKVPTDVFGVAIKNGGEWRLVAARFLQVDRRDIQALATKDTCLSCHNPDIKVVGPSYRDVAASYRNDPDAVSKIIAQMENGGKDKWGVIPMPPLKTVVPMDDMPKLANWIFGYRWDAILAE